MIQWHGWQILLIDNSCKQKAQLRLMKIEIARCNLAGGEKSFVGVVWPQFDHKRNETSWHPMKQNDIIHLKFNDTESRQYRIVHCVFERSTMGFKRPWVRFSPLGPNKNNPNLFPIGDGFGLFFFFGKFNAGVRGRWNHNVTVKFCRLTVAERPYIIMLSVWQDFGPVIRRHWRICEGDLHPSHLIVECNGVLVRHMHNELPHTFLFERIFNDDI